MYNFIKHLTESPRVKLEQIRLSYKLDELDPSISEDAMKYHFGKLYKTYVERYNNQEGDIDFNEAGAFLHSKYFSQFRQPKISNSPSGNVLNLIEQHYKTWDKFKEEFINIAMGIQGSGWIYLSKDGKIKTIVNHEIKQDIVLLIDWWEHAWALDYQADKKKYLENQWKIINWEVINQRI